jgi:deoxyadenosine/deoxycytidine kinase
MSFQYIAIEGPIGTGKTALARRLAARLDAATVLEERDNPFLADFYAGRPGAALQAQLFYLLNRHRQQITLRQANLFSQTTIADYLFDKDKIFAYLNLDDSELLIYDKLYAMLEPQVPQADLVIFLQAETRTLVERIKRRRRDYEQEISEAYVNEVNKAYNYYFFHYVQTPLLVIDTTSIDFVHQSEHLEELEGQIRKMDRGVQYYRPLGSSV